MLQALQRNAGNAAATAYVQRLAESPGQAASTAVSPQTDPRFQSVAATVAGQGRRLRQHPPPRAEAQQAAKAAAPPATDKEAKAKASQADTMSTAKPGGFDKAGFIAAVKKAIAAQAPKNLDQAENFEESGKAKAVKAEVSGRVTEGEKTSAQDIAEKTAAAPDTSKVPEKPVTPLRPEPQPTAPRVNTAAAMPAPVPAAQTDLSGDQRETDTAMAEAGVTEQQLASSNEPEFTDALAAKKEGEEHSATAPAAFRETEATQLGAAKQEAQGAGAAGLAGMLATKKGTLSEASAGKTAAKTQEEAERARIATQIKAIFDATKTDVDAILGSLDAKVDQEFSTGEAQVRKAFTADLNARMEAYKDKRYSGLEGKVRWADDLFGDLPKEADQCYVEARVLYEQNMDGLITRVADLIGKELTAAKNRIAKGRADIKTYVDTQPKNLRKLTQQAAGQFASQFDQLENDVDAKKDALVDDLATKYSESKAAVEEEITAMQEENKGLWSRAKAAVGGAIQTITQLKDLLTSALARAAGAIGKIIKDPIGFLGKFVNAVKGGIVRFGENIAEHLKAGLQGWLLGSLSAAGIELPAKLDLKGIIGLVLSLLGLTWPAIRARIAKHIPEKVMSGVEKSVAFIQVILSEGVGGLWKWVVAKLGDIKEMVMGQIREFVITKIVKAGITWLISMLNPAAAFIKACKMIYDVVMFFVEKAAQIKEFVDSVLDSVESIADGGVGAVAGYIEKTLAKMVPVLLGFLASLLGLGGISEKVKEILTKVQKPVGQVVDKLITGAVKVGKKLLRKLGGAFQKGKDWIRAKREKKGSHRGDTSGPSTTLNPGKHKRRDEGIATAVAKVNAQPADAFDPQSLRSDFNVIRQKYGMHSLTLIPENEHWNVEGAASPKKASPTNKSTHDDLDSVAQRIRTHLAKNDIVEFLLALGRGETVDNVNFEKFKETYHSKKHKSIKDYIKRRFRNADAYTHEWIPTNLLTKVIEQDLKSMKSPKDALKPGAWLILQHHLRTPTRAVIWNFEIIKGKSIAVHAHVGSFVDLRPITAKDLKRLEKAKESLDRAKMKKRNIEKAQAAFDEIDRDISDRQKVLAENQSRTDADANSATSSIKKEFSQKGTVKFHDALRDLFTDNQQAGPKLYLPRLKKFILDKIWNGRNNPKVPRSLRSVKIGDLGAAFYLDDSTPKLSHTLGDIAKKQAEEFDAMKDMVDDAGKKI